MKKKPTVELLENRSNGSFLLVHYAVRKELGWTVAWGKPVAFTPNEFRVVGMAEVMRSLKEFFSRDGDDKAKVLHTPESEQLKLVRDHLSLGVRQESPTLLMLSPSHRRRGGYIGREQIELPLPVSPAAFFEAVEAAFRKCS
jgi:hypothetical protein